MRKQGLKMESREMNAFMKYTNLMEEFIDKFSAQTAKAGRANDDMPILVQGSMRFTLRALKAMNAVLDQDEENVVLCCVLCRTCYELAVRLLWAAREPNGWQRLWALWEKETVKFVESAKTIPFLAPHVQDFPSAEDREAYRRGLSADRVPAHAPDLAAMIQRIDQRNVEERLTDHSSVVPREDYVSVYQLLCRATHAHVATVLPSGLDGHFSVLIQGIRKTILTLVHAACIVENPQYRHRFYEQCQKIRQIIQEERRCREPQMDTGVQEEDGG